MTIANAPYQEKIQDPQDLHHLIIIKVILTKLLIMSMKKQATEYAFSTAVAPTLAPTLQANTAGLLECAQEYNKLAAKLQEAIDQFWIDAKTNLFNDESIEYRDLLMPVALPSPGADESRPTPSAVAEPGEGDFYGEGTGARLAAFAGSETAGLGFPYTTYALKEFEVVRNDGTIYMGPKQFTGQTDWASTWTPVFG